MLTKIISGGQTGADQAGWRAANAYGVPAGGSMPRGFLTVDGPRPEFAEQFGAVQMSSESYPWRTEQNVRDADATVWFGETTTSGANATIGACRGHGKPCFLVSPSASFEPSHLAAWLTQYQVRVLNVAGNRESDEPGIGAHVERFMEQVLELLGHRRV
jgi:hypothetical protein